MPISAAGVTFQELHPHGRADLTLKGACRTRERCEALEVRIHRKLAAAADADADAAA
eukprot:CAMPEP_0183583818 /NCGR_PEP_ID=MMETSP0371-20130417/152387_1 /TAXON_ID=268820 /ORGANISM="Peridinium aciculiferum, Strain PAER-2" /LENGTH=56 /DNA_ID=CAMNT_0025794699 /DNA_START=329 /DNA_END=496 /DNA_ORIENTATION=-